ncbi:DUF221-domain-containing protein [Suhomyces tanzawaensis NRRL Y-17324]|uniref:DUF221-domain-containing protein n=1 Tax=Suhomyces tanzawaensis NRRL Y-17324 TaxID=984487 RepID=A0A1E4SNB2_9ASCO|nr:DUF221-domain-containing protein [Suhomyces tanzawaensis NRRL Y-17324]ODV81011.1 DUF221-domain-containing protein [Suhomyces tanzawaensis NRRL Y-17324]
MTWGAALDDPPPDAIIIRGQQRVFTAQLIICLATGIASLILFCILRYRWPHIYAVRTLRKGSRKVLKPLPAEYFGWMSVIYSITDEEILTYSGLDAYVFLAFFKMGIKIFLSLALMAIFILSPIRYHYTGNYDKDNIALSIIRSFYIYHEAPKPAPPDFSDDFPTYLWVYPIFTYVFSTIVYYYIFQFTKEVLKTRQKYLASQNSITDRTIRLDGIPKKLLRMNNPLVLKNFIEGLGIGKVMDVKLIYDWTPLEKLFAKRKSLISTLEDKYASHYNLNIDIYNQNKTPSVLPDLNHVAEDSTKDRKIKKQIADLSRELVEVNLKIRDIQKKFDSTLSTIDLSANPEFKQVSSAFITMDSVASAQMAAQTVLDPRVYKLIVNLAPAPKDIRWENFKLSYYQKLTKSYLITFTIILSYAFIVFLVTPLTTLLDLKTIKKLFPALGEFISESKWLTTFVTGILPPLLFSLLNILLPYFYKYLSRHQGYFSNSDIELSTLLKNFFFIFFNLFLVFMITGTIWDYISYISDTTKIAYQLARSLKKLSLFYVDLILLQGLAMFPVKLLQISDFLILNIFGKFFLLKAIFLKTPRDYRSYYYTPQIFDFGIHLPQHIMIFIIILIYSVVSTKIVTSGLVYFVLGFFVYKYQLVYNFVHPPHSTGKVWPMIFRRLILGILIFQLFMCGTLALEGALLLAALCSPLILATAFIIWNFEKYYLPLNTFIALRAIQNPFNFDKEFDDDRLLISNEQDDGAVNNTDGSYNNSDEETLFLDESSVLLPGSQSIVDYRAGRLKRRASTIDEEREQFTDYTYPYLIDPLHGPWIGFEGDSISMVQYNLGLANYDLEDGDTSMVSVTEHETILKKRLRVSEWE